MLLGVRGQEGGARLRGSGQRANTAGAGASDRRAHMLGDVIGEAARSGELPANDRDQPSHALGLVVDHERARRVIADSEAPPETRGSGRIPEYA